MNQSVTNVCVENFLACRGHEIEVASSGITVTLIDFTLSRLTTVTGDIAFCNLAADPELFAGPKGDVQVSWFPSSLCL